MKRLPPSKERDIQKSITDYLAWRKDIYFVRNNSLVVKTLRANGSTGWIRNGKPGSPDIIVCYKGRWMGLEVKAEKGRVSALQEEARLDIERAGGEYHIVRSLDDVIKILV